MCSFCAECISIAVSKMTLFVLRTFPYRFMNRLERRRTIKPVSQSVSFVEYTTDVTLMGA